MLISLNDVSKKLKISKDTLRYYEKANLITPIRKENNYRYYTEEDITKLKYIKVMKYNRFSLKEIEMIIKYFHTQNSNECFLELNQLLKAKQEQIQLLINNLEKTNILINEIFKIKEGQQQPNEVITLLDSLVEDIAENIIKEENYE